MKEAVSDTQTSTAQHYWARMAVLCHFLVSLCVDIMRVVMDLVMAGIGFAIVYTTAVFLLLV